MPYSITQVPAIGSTDTISDVAIINEFVPVVDISGGLKVDTITTTGNVDISGSLNVETSLTTKQLIVNENSFDTIVLRRPTGITGVTGDYAINLYELQCWVNNTNTLYDNSSNLVSYFAYWTDKEDEVPPSIAPSALYDNDITFSGRMGSNEESRDDLVVIIKMSPKHPSSKFNPLFYIIERLIKLH